MREKSEKNITLALETGVLGGSIAIFEDERIIDEWIGDALNRSRSEDVLQAISESFSKSDIAPQNLKQIFISKGPGSFTGLRIGMSIAKGLQAANGAEIFELPLLPALIHNSKGLITIGAVLANKREVYWRLFSEKDTHHQNNLIVGNAENSDIKKSGIEEFLDALYSSDCDEAFVTKDLFELIETNIINSQNDHRININMVNPAHMLGRYGISIRGKLEKSVRS